MSRSRPAWRAQAIPWAPRSADFDNDGHPDLFVAGVNRNTLYRNLGNGRFEDVTAQAGIPSGEWAVAAGWFDYDRDGKLDLWVVHYAKWSIGRGPLLRRRRPRHPHLLPSEIFHRPRQHALSQSRRRHFRGRHRESRPGEVPGPRHERRVRGLRRRRLAGRLRHQRQHAELPVPQSGQRHVRGGGPAGRRRLARRRQAGRQHGRRVQGLRQRRPARHLLHRARRRDLSRCSAMPAKATSSTPR